MQNKNSIAAGIFLGLIFPALFIAMAWCMKDNVYIINKPALPYLIAIALNLGVMRFCSKKEMVETVKGLMISTFLFMMVALLMVTHALR